MQESTTYEYTIEGIADLRNNPAGTLSGTIAGYDSSIPSLEAVTPSDIPV